MSKEEKFSDRVSNLRRKLGLNQESLANMLGVSRNYVSMLEGGREPSASLKLLVEKLEQQERTEAQGDISPSFQKPSPSSNSSFKADIRSIPILSWAHAGEAVAYEELPQTWQPRVPTFAKDERSFAIEIEGDSMEPKFSRGDVVILLPSIEPRNGDLVIAKLTVDGVCFKIYHRSGNVITLSSYNSAYPSVQYAEKDFHWIYPVDSVIKKIRR